MIEFIQQFPQSLQVFFISMLPIFELRGSIPYAWAIGYGASHPVLTYFLAISGNFVPVIPILTLLEPVDRHLRKIKLIDTVLTWLFKRTESRSKMVRRYKALGLILFVAIPAPMTGAWTGSVAAYLFKIPLRTAIPCIILGISIAGVVVSILSFLGKMGVESI